MEQRRQEAGCSKVRPRGLSSGRSCCALCLVGQNLLDPRPSRGGMDVTLLLRPAFASLDPSSAVTSGEERGRRAGATGQMPRCLPALFLLPLLPQFQQNSRSITTNNSKMKTTLPFATTLLLLLLAGLFPLETVDAIVCCYVGCSTPQCNPWHVYGPFYM